MGGRGASSSKETYEQYVARLLSNKEYLKANRPGEFALQYPEEANRNLQKAMRTQDSREIKALKENRKQIEDSIKSLENRVNKQKEILKNTINAEEKQRYNLNIEKYNNLIKDRKLDLKQINAEIKRKR